MDTSLRRNTAKQKSVLAPKRHAVGSLDGFAHSSCWLSDPYVRGVLLCVVTASSHDPNFQKVVRNLVLLD